MPHKSLSRQTSVQVYKPLDCRRAMHGHMAKLDLQNLQDSPVDVAMKTL